MGWLASSSTAPFPVSFTPSSSSSSSSSSPPSSSSSSSSSTPPSPSSSTIPSHATGQGQSASSDIATEIETLFRQRNFNQVYSLFEQARSDQITLPLLSYATIVMASFRSQQGVCPTRGMDVLMEMDKHAIAPDLSILTSMANRFSGRGYLDQAFDMVERLYQQKLLTTVPSGQLATLMVRFSNMNRPDSALKIYSLIETSLLEGQAAATTSVVAPLVNGEALAHLNGSSSSTSSTTMSSALTSAAIDCHIKMDSLEQAVALVDGATASGIHLDAASYNGVVRAYQLKGDLSSALTLAIRMRNELGVSVSFSNYSSILQSAIAAKQIDQALLFWRSMRSEQFALPLETYEAMVTACCSNQSPDHLASVMHVLKDMQTHGVKFSSAVYKSVLRACFEQKQHHLVRPFFSLVADVARRWPKPLSGTAGPPVQKFLVAELIYAGEVQEAGMFLQDMRQDKDMYPPQKPAIGKKSSHHANESPVYCREMLQSLFHHGASTSLALDVMKFFNNDNISQLPAEAFTDIFHYSRTQEDCAETNVMYELLTQHQRETQRSTRFGRNNREEHQYQYRMLMETYSNNHRMPSVSLDMARQAIYGSHPLNTLDEDSVASTIRSLFNDGRSVAAVSLFGELFQAVQRQSESGTFTSVSKKSYILRSSVVWEALLLGLVDGCYSPAAFRLLKTMVYEHRVIPHGRTFDVLLTTFADEANWSDKCEEVMRMMKAHNVNIHKRAFHRVLLAAFHDGNITCAKKAFQELSRPNFYSVRGKREVYPSSYVALIRTFLKGNQPTEAYKHWLEMHQVFPDLGSEQFQLLHEEITAAMRARE
eukprot:TRINITY_DN2309_c0_g1_i2.p1 TRINITY_DN2309_c0_g1~~TRINITY_DN2309_c0_g1_i2.p1  ORF type:complete len:822 (+),score=162.51 TRINITY_DN2309_c0_g1_i2:1603-4068(+)